MRVTESPAARQRPRRVLTPETTLEPIAVSPSEAARLLGVGRTTVYELLGDGRLRATKLGARTLIRTESIRALLTPTK